MSKRRKWRRWCQKIDEEILEPYKYEKLIYENYLELIESNEQIQSPPDFHNWCCQNYGVKLLLYVRKLADKQTGTYSIRKLVGDIVNDYKLLTRNACLRCYRPHEKRLILGFWDREIGSQYQCLPRSVALQHLSEIDKLTSHAKGIIDKSIAHYDRNSRYRVYTFENANKIIYQLIEILHFYSVLVGNEVACDIDNFSIEYDWMSIFNKPWKS
jgi:hypothetical protein